MPGCPDAHLGSIDELYAQQEESMQRMGLEKKLREVGQYRLAKFSGQLGRFGPLFFWPILIFMWWFWGSPVVPLAS